MVVLALSFTSALWHVKDSLSAEVFRKVTKNSYVQGIPCFEHLFFITACRGEELSRFSSRWNTERSNFFPGLSISQQYLQRKQWGPSPP